MATFTPGPWAVKHERWVMATRGTCEGEILAVPTYWMETAREETHANARLVAAAPDLLAALKDILAAWEKGPLTYAMVEPIHHAREIVSKAEGGA